MMYYGKKNYNKSLALFLKKMFFIHDVWGLQKNYNKSLTIVLKKNFFIHDVWLGCLIHNAHSKKFWTFYLILGITFWQLFQKICATFSNRRISALMWA